MKKIAVQIFTEEYRVNVCIGKRKEIVAEAAKYLGKPVERVEKEFENARGMAWNCMPESNPFIIIDGALPAAIALSTLAHEASHALDYIKEFLCMDDRSGEFHAHGVAAVMRQVQAQFKGIKRGKKGRKGRKGAAQKGVK